MQKDTALRMIFDGVVMRAAGVTGACVFQRQGSIHMVSKYAIYIGTPTEDDDVAPNTLKQYSSELPLLELTDINKTLPHILCETENIPFELPPDYDKKDKIRIMPVSKPPFGDPGIWLMEPRDTGYFYLRTLPFKDAGHLVDMPTKVYAIPPEIWYSIDQADLSIEDFRPTLTKSRLSGFPVLMLTGDQGILSVTLSAVSKESPIRDIEGPDGLLYCTDAYQDSTQSFKKVIKQKGKNKMRGLGNPVKDTRQANVLAKPAEGETASAISAAVKTAPEVDLVTAEAQLTPTATTTVETAPIIPAVIPEEQDAIPMGTVPAADTFIEPDLPCMPEKTEEPVQEAAEPADVATQRRRRKKPANELGFDFASAIEYLSTPVPELKAADLEAALEEARAIRDLTIAAARRSANLLTAMHKASAETIINMAKLKEVLNGMM